MIEFHSVYKHFGRRRVFENLNFKIAQNDWIFLYGKSGSGKTTILKMIAAFLYPDSGVIKVGEYDLAKMRLSHIPYFRRRIGFIFQESTLLPKETILRNVMYPLVVQGVGIKEAQTRAYTALDAVGIGEYADDLPRHLSGGQQQLANIARAIVGRPEILIADEPTANLDKSNAEMIISTLKNFHNAGATCIISTHVEFHNDPRHRRVRLENSQIYSI